MKSPGEVRIQTEDGAKTWQAKIIADGNEEVYVPEGETDSYRMQLMCVIEGLERLGERSITVFHQHNAIHGAMTQGWLDKWRRGDWTKNNGDPVKHRDLWERIERANSPDVTWVYEREEKEKSPPIEPSGGRGYNPGQARQRRPRIESSDNRIKMLEGDVKALKVQGERMEKTIEGFRDGMVALRRMIESGKTP